MMKQRTHRNLSRITAWIVSVLILAGFCPQGVSLADLPITLPKVNAAENISNPKIVEDSSMTAGQKVTWDCVYFGSYPQSEVTSEDVSIYNELVNATGWDENNDITIAGTKYRRLKGEDATYATSGNDEQYDWNGNYTTYHYFKYEPIKWRVLNRNGNDALLLADVALDDQKYNTNCEDVTWETSSMRSWLNGYGASVNQPKTDYSKKNFINSAFTSTQKNAIKTTSVANDNNINYETTGENNTSDKIFLLSESEVYNTDTAAGYGFVKDRYTYDEARRSRCSTYAYAMGTYRYYTTAKYNGNIWWWLRSPGYYGSDAARVGSSGWVRSKGSSVYYRTVGVRPALYLNLASSTLYSYAGTVCSDGKVEPAKQPSASDKEKQPEKKVKARSIRLSGLSKQIAAGKKLTLKATILPKNASNKKLTWRSSNTKIATVTQKGVVTLKKKTGGKKVTITARSTDGSKKYASWKITSMKGIVKKVKITGNKSVKAGKKLKLKAKVTATKKANTKLLWTSSNTKYATVNSKGVVTTKKSAKGKTVKITAMATDGSGKKQTVKIKIKS